VVGLAGLAVLRFEKAISGAAFGDFVPSAEPAPARAWRPCVKPLPAPLLDPAHVDLSARVTGLTAGVLETETDGCGPLVRRYLVRAPERSDARTPVLIVLHDAGGTPELSQIFTRWWFDDLATRDHLVLVYAHGGPVSGTDRDAPPNAGVWQTDPEAHPAVDDLAYLKGITDDLRRLGIADGDQVYLAGIGSGATMALAAAVRHPERYAGAVAFVTKDGLRLDAIAALVRASPAASRLRSLVVVVPEESTGVSEDPSALAVRLATALGNEPGPIRVTREPPGVQRVRSRLATGVELEVLRLASGVDPFPLPGGGDPITRAASEARPAFFDGPGAAWAAFLRRSPPLKSWSRR
jgi:pimeloyl-ACP methyl ester carboxylesterase